MIDENAASRRAIFLALTTPLFWVGLHYLLLACLSSEELGMFRNSNFCIGLTAVFPMSLLALPVVASLYFIDKILLIKLQSIRNGSKLL